MTFCDKYATAQSPMWIYININIYINIVCYIVSLFDIDQLKQYGDLFRFTVNKWYNNKIILKNTSNNNTK